jgi:hypothetical protein
MTARFLTPLLVAGLLLAGWGVAGLLDRANVPYDGFTTGPDYTVIRVRPGSPAAAAGLRVGDRLIRVNGVAVEDAASMDRMPRPAIGETRTLLVESGAANGGAVGATRNVAITYAALPGRDMALSWANLLVGLCYVGFGLLAYWKAPGKASLLLALTGIGLGLALLPTPYIASHGLRQAVGVVQLALIVFGFATLLHCLSVFPKPKAILQRAATTRILYAPAVAVALLFAWLFIGEPSATGAFNSVVNAIVGIYVVAYFGLALVALVHSFATASPSERSRGGLNLLLAGVVLGLVPVTVASLVSVLAPSMILPGGDFYALTLALVPIALALAVIRSGRPVSR